ncbi:putative diguanylate cyclase with GAF sensor [Nitrospira lenta]|uniref:diguanylate cyclase n=1 Tax=Nitrospira lenta TaxID=1436998 RepID=A0A330L5N4_9BACT|nr:putative diguanylate cyclase with GAF sensor [Nitrospira lenta]
MSQQSHDGRSRILLAGTPAFHRDMRWIQLARQGLVFVPVAKRDCTLITGRTADVQAIVYQAGARAADTLAFLKAMAARQSDLCIILVGRNQKPDTVAQFLRNGAFDYVNWPCSLSRLTDSLTSGLTNRQIFLEVRNLSGDLATANQSLAHERDTLKQFNQRLAGLNQLTQALARSLQPEDVVQALFTGVPALIGADLIGLVRTNPEHVWTWSKDGNQEREQALNAQLLGRLGRAPQRVTAGATTLRLVGSHPMPSIRSDDALLALPQPDAHAMHDIPLAIGPHAIGVLHVQRAGSQPFTEDEQQLLATIGTSLSLTLRNADAHQDLHDMALRDPLTGVFNRRALDEPLMRELKAGLRYGAPACLAILDLDYFKTVNDRLGHTAGDLVLRELASLMTDTVRDVDMVGRYGGEEFAIILPHTSIEQAQPLAERLRNLIETHAFDVEDGTVRLTASIGIAEVCNPAIASVEDWVNAADTALYHAKAQGRNRVVVHAPVPLAPVQAATLCVAA